MFTDSLHPVKNILADDCLMGVMDDNPVLFLHLRLWKPIAQGLLCPSLRHMAHIDRMLCDLLYHLPLPDCPCAFRLFLLTPVQVMVHGRAGDFPVIQIAGDHVDANEIGRAHV